MKSPRPVPSLEWLFHFFVLVALPASAWSAPRDFLLVQDGRAAATIVTAAAPSTNARAGALELQRYARRLVEINPRSVPGLQGLTLVAVERGEMEVAARHFAALAEQTPDLRGTPDDDVMEYRVSRKAIDRIRECISRQPVKPAARRY